MQDLTITLVQANLIWENAKQNLLHFDALIKDASETDLIILPEMFSTGFSMKNETLAERMQGNSVAWMKQIAQTKNCVITGSLIIEDNSKFYNRLIWMQPDGEYFFYDKRHLFSLAGEEKFYTAGEKRIFPEIDSWKMLPLICYDLRFPIWSRQSSPYTEMGNHPYDVLIFTANWPEKRISAWKQLLIARAIENQCYVIGVNRVGNDGNDIYYNGCSCVIDPMGSILFEGLNEECVKTISLSKQHLTDIRNKFKFLNDRDEYEIRL
ncbi:MAG: amidohydrolase [Fimbriimonadaceae bacterium]|nr:amidohydrolase [Chitinophagales bacterium]